MVFRYYIYEILTSFVHTSHKTFAKMDDQLKCNSHTKKKKKLLSLEVFEGEGEKKKTSVR